MYPIKQSTAITVPFFVHDASGDAVTGLTDGSFTKRISKNGAAFGAMTVTISEMENGWYSIPLSTSHSDTLGILSITFTNAGAKQVNLQWRVEARTLDDLAFPTSTGNSIDVTATGAVGIDWGNVENASTAVDLSATDIQLCDTVTTLTGHTAQTGDTYALANGPAGFVAIDTVVDSILVDTGTTIPALLPALISGTADSGSTTTVVDAALTETDTDYWKDSWIRFTSGTINGQTRLITGFAPATDTITFTPATTQAVGTNTYEILPASKVVGATLVDTTTTNTDMRGTDSAALASVCTEARLAELDAANLPTDVSGINTEVLKVTTTAHAEPTGIPAANETVIDKVGYLFMGMRNKLTVDGTDKTFYNDGGTSEWKKALSDDGVTYTEAEAAAP